MSKKSGNNKIIIKSINISEKKSEKKLPVYSCEVDLLGLKNDAHRGHWHRQVSLLDSERIEAFCRKSGTKINPGEFAENITLRGIDIDNVAILDRFKIGTVVLEITQIGKKCHGDCTVFELLGDCIMPKSGLFARVIEPGIIHKNDTVEYIPRPLSIKIITLSDRASKGIYKDTSGPEIEKIVRNHFKKTRYHLDIQYLLISDDPDKFQKALSDSIETNADFIFTTGGTGIGPRDFAPDVVLKMADKEIPGIMDHIRLKYGASNPNALLSRSRAVLIKNTAVFTLPGSTKAVKEYMTEILTVAEHIFKMVHSIGH